MAYSEDYKGWVEITSSGEVTFEQHDPGGAVRVYVPTVSPGMKMLDAAYPKPQRRKHHRIDDTLVAHIAAPFWAYVWCLSLGRFGKPMWTWE